MRVGGGRREGRWRHRLYRLHNWDWKPAYVQYWHSLFTDTDLATGEEGGKA